MIYQKTISITNQVEVCACYDINASNIKHLEHSIELSSNLGLERCFNEKVIKQGVRVNIPFFVIWEVWKEANRWQNININDDRLLMHKCFFMLMERYCLCAQGGELFLLDWLNLLEDLVISGECNGNRFEDNMTELLFTIDDNDFGTAFCMFSEVFHSEDWPLLYDAVMIVLYTIFKITGSRNVYVNNTLKAIDSETTHW